MGKTLALLTLISIELLPDSALAATGQVLRLAVVIGNNRPERAQQQRLKFADDDAAAMHALLTQAGVHSVLLTRLDADSQRQRLSTHPQGRPSWVNLQTTLKALAHEARQARSDGRSVELLVFYSGHGDVEHGEGYVLLEDRRLTRSLLHRQVLAAIPAQKKHLIVDACKSYFLAFSKGPGGTRRPYPQAFARRSAIVDASVGFVLSTSSARDSHEWERYQAGVFSYEVRSAMRGAADVDRNGEVSYAELGAFLTRVNQRVPYRYRSRFVVRQPGFPRAKLNQPVLVWRGQHSRLALDLVKNGHLYAEAADGERLLDAHPAAGQRLVLRLPRQRPLFVRQNDGDREHVLAEARDASLSQLAARPLTIARKGAAHLAFAHLFELPFSAAQVAVYRPSADQPTRARAAVLTKHSRRGWPGWTKPVAGWTALLGAAVAMGTAGWALERHLGGQDASQRERADRNATIRPLTIVAATSGAIALLAGGTWLATTLWPGLLRPAPRPGGGGSLAAAKAGLRYLW